MLNSDAWTMATMFSGDVGFAADITHKVSIGDEEGAAQDVMTAILLSRLGVAAAQVAGKVKGVAGDVVAKMLNDLKSGKTAEGVAGAADDAAREAAKRFDDIAGDVPKSNGIDVPQGKEIPVGKTFDGMAADDKINLTPSDAPKLTIRDHYDHHLNMVEDLKDQLAEQGYLVSKKEVSFGSSCGVGRCRPDIVAEAPDGSIIIIEVKTGNADLSIRQSEIFPQIKDGDAIPVGKVARDFGLIPGKPLKEQGYPNGIPIEVINFPGAQ